MHSQIIPRQTYQLSPITPSDLPHIHINQLSKLLSEKKFDYETTTFCFNHEIANCNFCDEGVTFSNFTHNWLCTTLNLFCIIPASILSEDNDLSLTKKNFNRITSFLRLANENFLNDFKSQKDVEKEKIYYEKTRNEEINGGQIKNLQSSKESLVRKKILGPSGRGYRLIVTINGLLKPGEVCLSELIWETQKLVSPFVVLNRDPSISTRCLYAVLVKTRPNDFNTTLQVGHVEPLGLNLDQDGDQAQIYTLESESEIPNYSEQCAALELRALSWQYGKRHDCVYNPRYNFSVYHNTLVEKFKKWFILNNPIFHKLVNTYPFSTTKEILDILMHLGCSVFREEIDNFLESLIFFIGVYKEPACSFFDLLTEKGDLKNLLNNSSKTTQPHIQKYLEDNISDNENFFTECVDSFNKFVRSSNDLSKTGTKSYNILFSTASLQLRNDNCYNGERIYIKNFYSGLTAPFFYNTVTLNFLTDM